MEKTIEQITNELIEQHIRVHEKWILANLLPLLGEDADRFIALCNLRKKEVDLPKRAEMLNILNKNEVVFELYPFKRQDGEWTCLLPRIFKGGKLVAEMK